MVMVSVIRPNTTEEPIVIGSDAAVSLPDAWRDAVDELNRPLLAGALPTVAHDITISLENDRQIGVRTMYSVELDAPTAPRFSFTRRTVTSRRESAVLTEDRRFDEAVVVETDDPKALLGFLTHERRAAILQLLLRISTAEITNEHVRAWSHGVEQHEDKVTRVVRRLIEVAESVNPCWVNAPLDAQSVLHDLFNSDRDIEEISQRFDELYLGNPVSWAGEVLQVGATDKNGRRAAVFIGTADGQTAESGRVVALTALDPRIEVARGDVITVTGSMWNLDPKRRFFRID